MRTRRPRAPPWTTCPATRPRPPRRPLRPLCSPPRCRRRLCPGGRSAAAAAPPRRRRRGERRGGAELGPGRWRVTAEQEHQSPIPTTQSSLSNVLLGSSTATRAMYFSSRRELALVKA